ncbi:hypothetical protein [Nostoc sp. MS1]|uniref:hypothetical protein n=1 Tax=Nostoc sp. MS1 TaxID=2764711 RepID=UPI001CC6526A|nr:hypothetical protein [Nostoc sp. MS1]BCL35086.1 hypothetical protein NSMS1_15330 [Nostoc sp. MS1]
MKRNFSIWQITLPLCGVLIFALGYLTTIYMINGRYFFHLEVSLKGVNVTTDVDKRESRLTGDTHQIEEDKQIEKLKPDYK